MTDEIKVGRLRRDLADAELTITRAAAEEPVKLAFSASSEAPVERYFGTEILAHEASAIRMDRIRGGAVPLLFNHDWSDPIGMVDSAALQDRKLRVDAHLFATDRAREIDAMIAGGLRNISVGYQIHVVEEDTKTSTYRATDWEPMEFSVCTIPADPSIGIGRSQDDQVFPVRVTRADPPTASTAAITGAIMADLKQDPAGAAAQVDPVAVEKQRVKDLIATGEAYGKYIQPKDINDAIANGRSLEQFKDFVMSRMQAASDATPGIIVGMTGGEVKRYSFGRALVAAVTGDWSKAGLELEASRAVERVFGKAPEGFFMPADVFRRDFNVGTATEAGNLVATDLRTDLYVDALRAKLVASTLGMRVLTGLTSSLAIPRKSTASTLGTLTEIGSASESAPAIAQVTLTPKRVGAYVEVSKQALLQSSMAIEGLIRDDLIQGAAVLLENGIINGSGTAPQMCGLRNTTGMGTSTGGTAGAAPTWALMVGLETLCAAANAEPDQLAGYLMNTQTRGKLKTVQRGTNLNFIWENGGMPVNGYRVAVTNNVPANLTKGSSTTVCSAALFASDWSMAVLGLFGAPDITVDPYSLAATGQVRITLNQFADFGVRQPGAFAKIDDLLSA